MKTRIFDRFGAFSSVNKKTCEIVCQKLEEKYGEAFEAERIGDRIDTSYTRLYMRPSADSSLRFEALLHRGDLSVTDDYYLQIADRRAAACFDKAFSENGMNACARAKSHPYMPERAGREEVSPNEYAAKAGVERYVVYIAAEVGGACAEKLEKALSDAFAELGTDVVVYCYCYSSEKYPEACMMINENPGVSEAILEMFSPELRINAFADGGACTFRKTVLRSEGEV